MPPAFALLAIGWSGIAAARPAQEEPAATPRSEEVRLGTWFSLGPFDNPRGADVSQDPGVEKWLKRMKPGEPWSALRQTFGGRGKAKLGWRPVDDGQQVRPAGSGPFDTGVFDLRALCDAGGTAGDNAVAYLYCTLESEWTGTLELVCGSDDGLRLWFDGQLLIDHGIPRGLGVLDERLPLPLTPGTHHLLVKVANATGAWAFAMLEPRPVTPDEIDLALARGVDRLLELQLVDGSWSERQSDYPNGLTGLAVYTLLKCGLSPRHSAILQAVENLRAFPGDKTYALACQILGVAALHDPDQRDWLQAQCERLLAWQNRNGGWSYPGTQSDLSNTHLAAFSLRLAAENGIEIPLSVWNAAADYALRNQETRRKRALGAGFTYFPGHETGITGSMTAAGLAVLGIASDALGDRMTPSARQQVDPAIEAGLEWLAVHWSASQNPNKADWHLYYLYAIERVGALLDVTRIGGHDWYAEGANVLVPLQATDGGWGFQSDTCFALMFLRRATSRVMSDETYDPRLFATAEGDPLRLRARGGTPATLWIDAPHLDGRRTVSRVEFSVRPAGGDWNALPVAAGELAMQHEFERPGSWQVRADAVLSDGSHLVSSVLDVDHDEGIVPEQRDYARDALRNRMPALEAAVRCSSELEPAGNAVDNRFWTRWLCQNDDAEPWIEIDPARSAPVERLVFTHARTTRSDARYANPRPRRIELWLNREKAPRLVEIDPDPRRKSEVVFDPPVALARLKLRIVAIEGGELGHAAVGFSEIEARAPEGD